MTGVVKSVGKYALLAGTALALSISVASAASMTKAGMDKRVADLEREVTLLKNQMKSAMMAKPADKNIQSGNSRVKVTLYGQVNRAIRFANTGDATEITSVDNDGSSSRLGVRAAGKINPNLSIGALHELEWQNNARSGTNEGSTGKTRVRARHVDLWLDHKNFGKLSMGHGSIAGDAGGLYDLSGVGYIYGFAGANGTDGTKADASVLVANADGTDTMTVQATGKARGYRPFNFFGARENRIRYDTPSLMGARVGVSYNHSEGWSVGLTYAGAPPGVKSFTALFASGYRKRGDGSTAWAVSGGLKHKSSGFNVNGSYDTDGEENAKGVENSQWGITLGWSGKLNDSGATAIGIGFNRSTDGLLGVAQQYWVGINQSLDAAAADVYAGVSFDSGTVTHTVSAAEALMADVAYDAATGTAAVTAMPSPCFTEAADAITKADKGAMCEVERDGVINFLVGVRLKF